MAEPKAAFTDLQDVPDARTKIEAFAAQNSMKSFKARGSYYERSDSELDLSFLDQAPAMLADDRRRLSENTIPRDEEAQPEAIADTKQRVSLLIRNLEDVEAYPITNPGYIDFGFNPIVIALAKEGEAAVDPLLDCLEHDQRLTRTIDRGGALSMEVNGPSRIVGVEEPAFYALQAILQTQDQIPWLEEPYVNGTPGLGEHLDRVALAHRIRSYWERARGQSPELRWFKMLQNDKAPSVSWAEAATNLTQPANSGLGYGGVMVVCPVPLSKLGNLIAQRLHDAVARMPADKSPFPTDPSRKLESALTAWDAKGQLKTLRWWCDFLRNRVATENDSAGPSDLEDLTRAYLARIEVGDSTATSDYSAWIHSLNTKTTFILTGLYGPFYFAPVYSYPNDPAIQKLTHWLFETSDSPWSIGPRNVDPAWVVKMTGSPLVSVPAARALLLQQLENKQVVGSVEITKDNVMVNFVYGEGKLITDPETPSPGFKQALRLADIIACRLSDLAGFSRCEPYWPLEKRDAAIVQTIAFLKQFGNCVARKATSREIILGDMPFLGPLAFDKLDHPATQQEVAEGRAIFSLEGRDERRIIPLPHFPQQATWTTLIDYPSIETQTDRKGRVAKAKSFQQTCNIWQAEEVLVNGSWHRYYGLVAPHKLAMVPGEDLEILDPGAYDAIGAGWAVRVDLGPQSEVWEKRKKFESRVGAPVPVTIWIRNIKGADVDFPSFGGSAPISIEDAGFEFNLSYMTRPRAAVTDWPALSDVEWEPVSAKMPLHANLQPIPSRLESLQSAVISRFDAADYFAFPNPALTGLRLNSKSRILSRQVINLCRTILKSPNEPTVSFWRDGEEPFSRSGLPLFA